MLEYRGEIVTVPVKKGIRATLPRRPVATSDPQPGRRMASRLRTSPITRASISWWFVPRTARVKADPTPSKGPASTKSRAGRPIAGKSPSRITRGALYWIDLDKGTVKRVGASLVYDPLNTMTYGWSPDSKWLAYTLTNRAGFQTIHLYAVGSDQSHPLTDGLVEASEPVFDSGGKYLYFLALTDSGPVKNWFDQSNTDMRASSSVYLVTLAKATANPLLKESDEEGSGEADKDIEKKTELVEEQLEIGKKLLELDRNDKEHVKKAGGVRVCPKRVGSRTRRVGATHRIPRLCVGGLHPP